MRKGTVLLMFGFSVLLGCSSVQEKQDSEEVKPLNVENQALDEQSNEAWVVSFDIKKDGQTVSNPKAGVTDGSNVQLDLETYDESGEVNQRFTIDLLPKFEGNSIRMSGQIEGYVGDQLESTIEIQDSLSQDKAINREITIKANTYLILISLNKA